jgi:hypothetical protein
MKKIIFSLVITALMVASLAPTLGAEGSVKSYYSGSTAYYKGLVIVGTTNSGYLEIFKIDQAGNLQKFVNIKSYDQRFGTEKDFNDVMIRTEGTGLFAYAVDGSALYKYDISDLKKAQRINRVEDNSWDWFGSLTVIDGKVATVGSRGVKLWNSNLIVVDAYSIINTTNNNSYNITPSGSEKFLFNVSDATVSVFDRESRSSVLTSVPLDFKWGSTWYKRSIYNDKVDNSIYVIDDEAVRKINFNGEIEKSFRHTGSLGYDVIPSANSGYVYFSDGIGIVKLRKEDFKVVAYTYTANLGAGNGWVMGIRTVQTDNGERIVAFNGSSIIMLDSNLKPIKSSNGGTAFVIATVENTFPEITEALFLGIDKNHASANSKVILHGGGFGKDETLVVSFGSVQTTVEAGADGRFSQELTVPALKSGPVDIKVSGMSTAYTYSLGFIVE